MLNALKRRQRGFTLIELLVVIAIIGILASILFPVFNKAREKARQAQCISNQRQIALGIRMFADDRERFPDIDWFDSLEKIDKLTDLPPAILTIASASE